MVLNDLLKSIKATTHRGDPNITTDQHTLNIIIGVNNARRDVIQLIPKRWLHVTGASLSVVQSDNTYSLASTVFEPIVFWHNLTSKYARLKKVDSDREWFEHVYDPNAAEATPTHYREIGPDSSKNKQIQLFPTPSAALTLNYEYYKTPTATPLTVSNLATEIPDIPDELQNVLWLGAVYYTYKEFDDPQQQIAFADYEKAKLALDVADEQDQDSDLQFRWGLIPSSNIKTSFTLE